MIPTQTDRGTIESSYVADPDSVIAMTVDLSNLAHIMSVLTDLYSDRVMAVIREYSTNARDAHVMAGVDQPIQITLPSRMDQYFHVRDFGEGLDVNDLREVFSLYGASLKRDSNDVNGLLGLGCKSALTYTSQFSIVSIKNGIKYSVAVSRIEDGTGQMEVVDEFPTDEPSGLEIIIPVKSNDIYEFERKTNEFFQWWPEGEALVNGRPNKTLVMEKVADSIYTVDNDRVSTDRVVMGGVAYPLPTDMYLFSGHRPDKHGSTHRSFSVVYFAKMGEVTFTPSREGLQTTLNTKRTVERVEAEFNKHFQASLQAKIDACATHQQAWNMQAVLKSKYRSMEIETFTYEGKEIPGAIVCPQHTVESKDFHGNPTKKEVAEPWTRYDCGGGRNSVSNVYDLSPNDGSYWMRSIVLIVNSPKNKIGVGQKVKLRKAWSDGTIRSRYVLLVQDHPDKVWLSDVPTVDWSVIRDIKTGPTTSRAKPTGVFSVISKKGQIEDETLPTDAKLAFVSPVDWKDMNPSTQAEDLAVLEAGGVKLVSLNSNRDAKFQRDHANAKGLYTWLDILAKEYLAKVTPNTLTIVGMDSTTESLINKLMKSGIDVDDPRVLALHKVIDGVNTHAVRSEYLRYRHRLRGTSDKTSINSNWFLNEYPLLRGASSAGIGDYSHLTLYVNAVYNQKKEVTP